MTQWQVVIEIAGRAPIEYYFAPEDKISAFGMACAAFTIKGFIRVSLTKGSA